MEREFGTKFVKIKIKCCSIHFFIPKFDETDVYNKNGYNPFLIACNENSIIKVIISSSQTFTSITT